MRPSGPRFDPDTYPGQPPGGPVLVHAGRTVPLDPVSLAVRDGHEGAPPPVLTDEDRRWLVAFGSNASPARLVDKGLDRRGCLLLPARLAGWSAAWEARRSTSTGAVPLTLVREPGAVLDCRALAVHHADLDRLDASEFRGRNYRLGVVGEVAVAARWRLDDALAFGPGTATEVLIDGTRPLSHPAVDQRGAAAALSEGATRRRAEPLPAAVERDWPATPLADLDLFVYGTLQPGDVRWPRIERHVDVVGPVRTHGRLTATPHGWPAARFEPTGPALHGTLLRPRPGAAEVLFRVADEIEGAVGEGLFRRVAVPVEGADVTWAAAYEWNPDRGAPPGEPLPDGRWPG